MGELKIVLKDKDDNIKETITHTRTIIPGVGAEVTKVEE